MYEFEFQTIRNVYNSDGKYISRSHTIFQICILEINQKIKKYIFVFLCNKTDASFSETSQNLSSQIYQKVWDSFQVFTHAQKNYSFLSFISYKRKNFIHIFAWNNFRDFLFLEKLRTMYVLRIKISISKNYSKAWQNN